MKRNHFIHRLELRRYAMLTLSFLLVLGALLLIGPQQASATGADNPSMATGSSGAFSLKGASEEVPVAAPALPVTVNYFHATRVRGALSIDWATGSETSTVGFNLYIADDSGRRKINTALIPSKSFNTDAPQDYHIEIRASAISGKVKLYLEDVDNLGGTVLHGPFLLDQVYGKRVDPTLTDWQAINAQNNSPEATASAKNIQSVNDALQGNLKDSGTTSNNQPYAAKVNPTATATATRKAASTPTNTPKPTATNTPKPTATNTPKPTNTPMPTATSRKTPSATPRYTAAATQKPTATNTPKPTNTPMPTATNTPKPTNTPMPTATNTPPSTNTPMPTATNPPMPTNTPVPTATNTPLPTDTPVPTNTPTPTATNTPAPTSVPVVRIADLLVSQTGVYRLSYADLLAAGLDLAGKPVADLALTMNGTPVPILVGGGDSFGPNSTIEFFGQAIDTLYTNTNVYHLSMDAASAGRMAEDQTPADPGAPAANYYMQTTLVNNNKNYDELSTSGDPWYDTYMVVYTSPNSWNYPIAVDHYLVGAAPASLQVMVFGGTDYGSPGHHLVTSLNGVQLANQTFNGLYVFSVNASIADGTLVQGNNTLNLKLPGDTGMPADGVYLDRYSVTYPHSFWATNGLLTFSGSGGVYQVDNLTDANVVVYRVVDGIPTRLEALGLMQQGNVYQVRFNGGDQGGKYYVVSGSALLKPTIRAARLKNDITSGEAEYLVISHPDFIGGLSPLVQARVADGLAVKVVDVNAIYDQYSYGVIDPQAIKTYIAYAAANMETKYVLLVGDDTYDYKNYLNKGSTSFIPSIYMAVGYQVQFAPVDPEYADLDGDNIPDLPIGRLPVRTTTELSNVISKTLAYKTKAYGKSGVFAADSGFSNTSNAMVNNLPEDWVATRADLDTLGVTQAHNTLLAGLNAGAALVNYVGHADDWEWTYNNLFTIHDEPNLTNQGRPTLFLQEGCWSNYYVNPQYETLVEVLMDDGLQGAAGMFGATTEVMAYDEQIYGLTLISLLTQTSMRIGDAELAAKHALAVRNPGALDIFIGTNLLGDPALVVTP